MNAGERGSTIVLAIFVLALLASLAIALLFLTQHELRSTQASTGAKRTFYLAEAGIEVARRQLFDVNGSGSFSDDLATAAGTNGTIDFNVANLTAAFDVAGNLTGFAGYGDDVPIAPAKAMDSGMFAAFVTNDPVEGRLNKTDTNRRLLLTGIGASPDRSLEIVQAIIEPNDILPPIPTAAITLLGPTPSFASGSSSASAYSGTDCAYGGGGVPGLNVPIVGAIGDDALESAIDGMDSNPSYQSGSYSDEDTFVDLTDPSDPLLAGGGLSPIDPVWTDCHALRDMVEALRSQATYTCSGTGGSCNIPATTLSSISFLSGHTVSLGPGPVGSGLLVVTGVLTFQGSATWNGLALIIGRGQISRSGGGNGHISGGTIVADIAGPDDIYGTGDDCTGGPNGDGFGIANYGVNGGGNSDVDYCSTKLSMIRPAKTYKVVDFLQR